MFRFLRPSSWQIAAIVCAVSMLTLLPVSARADYLDPATLQVGSSVPPPGTHPNLLGDNGLAYVYQNQGGAGNLANPWLLVVGVANDSSGGTAFKGVTLTVSGGTGQLGGTNLYGGSWNVSTGFAGLMTSGGEAYSTLGSGLQGLKSDSTGYTGLDHSNNFDNWSQYDASINGITAKNFGIYVFEINSTLAAKSWVSIQFSSLPAGAYAIAYGQTPSGNNTQVFDTPFTQAGLETTFPVPGPSSAQLATVGCLALGLCGLMCRRVRRARPVAA